MRSVKVDVVDHLQRLVDFLDKEPAYAEDRVRGGTALAAAAWFAIEGNMSLVDFLVAARTAYQLVRALRRHDEKVELPS